MKAFRYNVANREMRLFNNTGREKNPNMVNFYAITMEYAEKYNMDDAVLEVKEVDTSNIFDMNASFRSLSAYRKYIDSQISIQLNDYTRFMNEATNSKVKKMWKKQIDGLSGREDELISVLEMLEFQQLSDFELQNDLVAELKELGFNGYITNREIAIF